MLPRSAPQLLSPREQQDSKVVGRLRQGSYKRAAALQKAHVSNSVFGDQERVAVLDAACRCADVDGQFEHCNVDETISRLMSSTREREKSSMGMWTRSAGKH
eukprot:3781270-Amphidinium_carterae.1